MTKGSASSKKRQIPAKRPRLPTTPPALLPVGVPGAIGSVLPSLSSRPRLLCEAAGDLGEGGIPFSKAVVELTGRPLDMLVGGVRRGRQQADGLDVEGHEAHYSRMFIAVNVSGTSMYHIGY